MALFKSHSPGKSQRGGKPGGVVGIIFGLIFTAFSSFFVFFGLKSSFEDAQQGEWPTVPCTIQSFQVKSKPQLDPPFQPKIKFTYRWEGKKYTGTKVWENKLGEEDFEDLSDLVERIRRKEITECRIDPNNPSEAVLFPDSNSVWLGIIFALFGAIFGLIGIGVAIASFKSLLNKNKPLSKKPKSEKSGSLIAFLFFGAFALAGLAVLIAFVIPMWQKYTAAKSWEPTEARVIWSTVRSHRGDDSTTYSVDIFYKYKVGDYVYRSNSYGLLSGSSSGREGKQEVVKQHPKGKVITCYVNPENPHQALLKRELGWWVAFSLFPLPFLAVGLGGLYFLCFGKSSSARSRHRKFSKGKKVRGSKPTQSEASEVFKPTAGRWLWFLGSIFLAAFWNGIVSVFLFGELIPSWKRGEQDWFLTLFLTPFVLIGLGFIFHIFYRFLACFNPAPELTLKPGALTPGEEASLHWKTLNGEHRIQNFAIYLVGEEVSTYRRGKNSQTDTSIFYEAVLLETSDPRKVRRGDTQIQLPLATHPTWDGDHNKIQWKLKLRGDIPFWPDINDDYDIEVLSNQSAQV